jgi:hypothetical protein
MHWLGKLFGLLLAISLAITVQAWVLNQTVWSADYLKSQMHTVRLADHLSTVLPDVLVQVTGESEETRLAMSEVLTPHYIQDQLDTLVPQMIAYLHGTAAQPIIDLRDTQATITNAGLPTPPKLKSLIGTPIPVSAGQFDTLLKVASTRSTQALWLGPLVSIVLIALIFILSGHRRWSTFAGSMVVAAILLGIMGALAYTPPQLIASALDTSAQKLLTPVVRPLAEAIAHDQAYALWVAALVALAGAAGLMIIHFIIKLFGHHHKKHKGAAAA